SVGFSCTPAARRRPTGSPGSATPGTAVQVAPASAVRNRVNGPPAVPRAPRHSKYVSGAISVGAAASASAGPVPGGSLHARKLSKCALVDMLAHGPHADMVTRCPASLGE